MKHSKKRLPLFWRIMGWITACTFAMLTVLMLITMHHTIRTFREKNDEILQSTVKTLAESPTVRQCLLDGACTPELAQYLDSVVENTSDLDYISIADADSVRIYHIDPAFVGKQFEGGDQYRALAGEHYFSDTGTENFPDQRRAFYPVRGEDGGVIGFVMASATHERITQIQHRVYDTYFRLFLVLTACAVVFSALLAVYLGRHLRGVRPEDLVRMYLAQNDTLNGLDEGLISFDTTGRVRLVNRAAADMLGQREDLLVGRNVDELIRLENGESLRDRACGSSQSNRPNILVRHVRLPDANLWARQVVILADKTDTMRSIEELTGTRHMVSTLRANTHEFLNKLQVISGLLQMGHVQQAQEYIGTISAAHKRIVGPVMQQIRNANVAALILGKETNRRELDIELTLVRNSSLPERSRYLSTGELVTVVGNLLENAMEAINAQASGGGRAVALQITEDERGLLILVSDTGVGISEKNLPHIFESGFSTKARSGRGVGMKLIRDIADRCGGAIDVETDPGSGTTISVIFSRERGETV